MALTPFVLVFTVLWSSPRVYGTQRVRRLVNKLRWAS